MTFPEIIGQHGTLLLAALAAVLSFVALLAVRSGELKRLLASTFGAMVLFLGLWLLRSLVARETELAAYLTVTALLVFAWAALRLVATIGFDVLPARSGRRPAPKIVRQVVFGVVYALVLVAILRAVLKIDLASLLATSAVLSLVLGLALQDTLGNLFAGLSLQAEKPFEVGDWVTFGTFTGRIVQVGWRTTQIEDFTRDLVSVPNNVIARESVTNHSRPSPITGVVADIGLSYEAPPNKVRAAILEVLRSERRVLARPEPVVRLVGYGDSSITYRMRYWVGSFDERYEAIDAVNSRLWYRLKRGGLEIPFPIRTVHLHQRDEAHVRTTEEARRSKLTRMLAGSELLGPLGADGQRVLVERGHEVAFGAGEEVFRAGDPGETCYLLLSGAVQAEDGHGRRLSRIEPGQIFGEGALLTGEPRTATVRALGDVDALQIDREAFREVLLANERIASELAAILEKRRAARPATLDPETAAVARAPADQVGLLGRIRDIFGLK